MNFHEWIRIGIVLAILAVGLPVIRRLVIRFGASPEVARKMVHVGMGLVCAVFPWIFDRPLPVFVLAVIATLPLVALRLLPAARSGIGSVLHGVERVSYGDVLFAPAVAVVFYLAQGDPYLHLIPVSILTIADAAGALAGTHWGRKRYGSGEGFKTVEGSLIFLGTAFLCCFIPLAFGKGMDIHPAFWISLIVATLGMMGEGLSDRGFDNLVIPLGGYYVLQRIIDLESIPLILRSVVLGLLLALVLTGARWSTLSGAALLGSALLGYACAVIGDWRFMLPPAAVFICHVVKTRKHDLTAVFHHRLDAVLSHSIACLPWVLAYANGHPSFRQTIAGISFAMATQLSILDTATRWWLPDTRFDPLRSTFKGWLIAALPGLIWLWPDFSSLHLAVAFAVPLSFAITLVYEWIHPRYQGHPTGLWIIKGVLALASSIPAFLISS